MNHPHPAIADIGPLLSAIDAQTANIDRMADFLSPEREAERKADFEAGMAELERIRGELADLLAPSNGDVEP